MFYILSMFSIIILYDRFCIPNRIILCHSAANWTHLLMKNLSQCTVANFHFSVRFLYLWHLPSKQVCNGYTWVWHCTELCGDDADASVMWMSSVFGVDLVGWISLLFPGAGKASSSPLQASGASHFYNGFYLLYNLLKAILATDLQKMFNSRFRPG